MGIRSNQPIHGIPLFVATCRDWYVVLRKPGILEGTKSIYEV